MYSRREPASSGPPGAAWRPQPDAQPHAAPDARPRLITPAMLVRMVLRRKLLLLVCGLAFAGLGLAWGTLVPPKYLATVQLILDPTDLRISDRALRTPNQYSDALIAQVENQVRVMTSESVIDRLIAAQRLDRDPEFNGTAPPGPVAEAMAELRGLFGAAGPAARPAPAVAARRALDKAIGAKREERTYVVNVSALTRDPEKSVRLADGVVAAYVAETADSRDALSQRIAGSLDARLDGLKRDVEEAERRVEAYRRENDFTATAGRSVTEQQLATANNRLGQAETATAQAQSRYDQVVRAQRAGDAGAVPDALQSQTVTGLRSQLTDAQRRLSDIATTRGERHPEMIEARAQADTVRRALNDELARIASAARTDLDRAHADEREMRRVFETMKAAVTRKDEAAVKLRELERAAQASRSVYESFLNRTRELSEQEKVDTSNVRVISRAQLPERRASPPRTLLLVAGGLLLGLCLGAGIAMVRGMMEGDVERLGPRRRADGGLALMRASAS